MTRITSQMMVTSSLHRLSSRLEQYERTQSRLATGKRMLVPSDAPGDASRALGLRGLLRAKEQEVRNADDAKSWLDITDSQLQAAMERLGRVRELAVRAASIDGTEEQNAIAAELETIRDELAGIANARNRGRPMFAGHADANPVAKTAGAWVYQGDDGVMQRRVGETDVVAVNVTARDAFGFPTASDPARVDAFTMLDQLIADVRSGDNAAVSSGIAGIDVARGRIGDSLAKVGAAANLVASALERTKQSMLTVRGELSQVEDVDMAEAVMELQTQQNAYEATMQALARALPPSLGSFLR